MIVRVSVVLNNCRWQSLMFWQLWAGLKKMLRLVPVKLSGQTYFCLDATRFWPDHYKYLLWHISIKLNFWSIRSVKDRTKYMVIQGFDQTKFTFHQTLFVDRLLFQALVWYSTFRAKVSCIMSVDGIKLWLLTWLVNWSVNWHCYWLSVSYTVSFDVIRDVDYKNKCTMNSKQKENSDHYKVSESIVADGIVG